MNLRALQQINLGRKHGQWGEHLPPDLINQHFQNNSNSIW